MPYDWSIFYCPLSVTLPKNIKCSESDTPQVFYLEVWDPVRMCIKNEAGRYVNGGKNGAISLGSADPESATKWEY